MKGPAALVFGRLRPKGVANEFYPISLFSDVVISNARESFTGMSRHTLAEQCIAMGAGRNTMVHSHESSIFHAELYPASGRWKTRLIDARWDLD